MTEPTQPEERTSLREQFRQMREKQRSFVKELQKEDPAMARSAGRILGIRTPASGKEVLSDG